MGYYSCRCDDCGLLWVAELPTGMDLDRCDDLWCSWCGSDRFDWMPGRAPSAPVLRSPGRRRPAAPSRPASVRRAQPVPLADAVAVLLHELGEAS